RRADARPALRVGVRLAEPRIGDRWTKLGGSAWKASRGGDIFVSASLVGGCEMRRFSSRFLVAFLSLSAAWPAVSEAQVGGWIQTNPPPHPADNRNGYLSVSVLPSQTVLVGLSGVIFQTTDDGVTWTRPDSGTRQGLNGVSFAAQAGIAVGENGTILRS